MKARYVDTTAIVQIIGSIYNNPNLLDMEDKYTFKEYDFIEPFHKILFGSIYNLHFLGAKEITINAIEDYLAQRPKKLEIYKQFRGQEYLEQLKDSTQLAAFDYYYSRMKKMTLLRMYNEQAGMDLSWLYDINNILDTKKKQAQEDWLDNTSIEEITEIIDSKITDIKLEYTTVSDEEAVQAGDGALELLERLKDTPDVGYPLYGPLINTVTRGARLKKFYLRSAATGVGKTRAMIADACNIACDEIYNPKTRQWEKNGTKEPTLFIGTEQDKEEIQTMMLAFLSNVNEEHLINGEYYGGEWERVLKAAEILKDSPLYIEYLPDFSLVDVENTIKRNIRNFDIGYVFFDYIHSSMKILGEITGKTGIKGLREDNVLFMLSTRLKEICNKYGVFILSSTQLNAEYKKAKQYDQNLLRGAKAIADRIDCGMIMLQTDQEDLEALEKVIKEGGYPTPTIKISIYKNRRSRYKDLLLWCEADRGTCRIRPMFATDYTYELINIDDLKIEVRE